MKQLASGKERYADSQLPLYMCAESGWQPRVSKQSRPRAARAAGFPQERSPGAQRSPRASRGRCRGPRRSGRSAQPGPERGNRSGRRRSHCSSWAGNQPARLHRAPEPPVRPEHTRHGTLCTLPHRTAQQCHATSNFYTSYLFRLLIADISSAQHGGFDSGKNFELCADGWDSLTDLRNRD